LAGAARGGAGGRCDGPLKRGVIREGVVCRGVEARDGAAWRGVKCSVPARGVARGRERGAEKVRGAAGRVTRDGFEK
jgi:hypothetical protein